MSISRHKPFFSFLLTIFLLFSLPAFSALPSLCAAAAQVTEAAQETEAAAPDVDAVSAIVMEASTGAILYKKNAEEALPPASVTKVMTLLLIFEALDAGQISLDDTVTVSAHAASMGGSQVFLETGETQSVETMIKCIAVASGNDACVSMAEYISGSEEAFVTAMNARAKELGMEQTHFVNCCGLDADGHLTSAKDIALMSRELTVRHPDIFQYTQIWMENITHVTARGTSEFGLTNTNKLLKQYQGATGLKTGSTSKAKFCLSATATRNDISLIAVVMGCESSAVRITAASSLLDYGFSQCHIYKDETPPAPKPVSVRGGVETSVACEYEEPFSCVTTEEIDASAVTRRFLPDGDLRAPVKAGDVVGQMEYYVGETKLGSVNLLAGASVKKARYGDYFKRLLLELS